jgi:hypothetical protein
MCKMTPQLRFCGFIPISVGLTGVDLGPVTTERVALWPAASPRKASIALTPIVYYRSNSRQPLERFNAATISADAIHLHLMRHHIPGLARPTQSGRAYD